MSNWALGELEVQQERAIYSTLTVDQLVQSKWYRSYFTDCRELNNEYVWYSFRNVPLSSVGFSLSLAFKDSIAHMVILSIDDDKYGSSWDDWTEAKELERKRAHDYFLAKVLQRKPDIKQKKPYPYHEYDFVWGTIISSYDPRSASSSISIHYSSQNKR